MSNEGFDDVNIPPISELRNVCVWLAKAGYNDHSFKYIVNNVVANILNQAGCFTLEREIESLLEGSNAWLGRTDEENFEIVKKVIQLLEDM